MIIADPSKVTITKPDKEILISEIAKVYTTTPIWMWLLIVLLFSRGSIGDRLNIITKDGKKYCINYIVNGDELEYFIKKQIDAAKALA